MTSPACTLLAIPCSLSSPEAVLPRLERGHDDLAYLAMPFPLSHLLYPVPPGQVVVDAGCDCHPGGMRGEIAGCNRAGAGSGWPEEGECVLVTELRWPELRGGLWQSPYPGAGAA
ncbi:hypothetical protein ElyMa_007003900 [Elysia marginata]|uniref:Uncharacterized protein n=1 Tax=Elysia marginata TaxID=1093978 RepID=A0AAV4JRZ3_9GAST|nr:hypothetical protein ElyMa_007003900 [Elysia marginata]